MPSKGDDLRVQGIMEGFFAAMYNDIGFQGLLRFGL